MVRTGPVLGFGLGACLAFAPVEASAHSKSEVTTPADGTTVTSVDTIEIRFDAPMRVTAISLAGDSGDIDLERETGMEPTEAFLAHPSGALEPGEYRVEWRGLSADGHPMQGAFSFTVEE